MTKNFSNKITELGLSVCFFFFYLCRPKIFYLWLKIFTYDRGSSLNIAGAKEEYRSFFSTEKKKTTLFIFRFVITIVTVVVCSPHLPGAGTPYLAGITALFGLAFSLSATAAIADVIAGLILIYVAKLNKDEWVQIGDVMGQVVEQHLLVHRIRTFDDTLVSLPNSKILNNIVTNFSDSKDGDKSFALQTHVTLRYSTPFSLAETIFKNAASKVTGVKPKRTTILQSRLDNCFVNYTVKVFTDQPHLIPLIHSELHENIILQCHLHNVEMITPQFDVSMNDDRKHLDYDDS